MFIQWVYRSHHHGISFDTKFSLLLIFVITQIIYTALALNIKRLAAAHALLAQRRSRNRDVQVHLFLIADQERARCIACGFEQCIVLGCIQNQKITLGCSVDHHDLQVCGSHHRVLFQLGTQRVDQFIRVYRRLHDRHLIAGLDLCIALGCLLRGVAKTDIERGQVLCKPGSVTPHTKFTGEIYVLTKEEGGRHTPFFDGYRPQFYFRTTDVTGTVKLPEGTEMAMPGDHITIEGDLIHPIAMEEGLRFAIREGGHTVGSGIVSTIIE